MTNSVRNETPAPYSPAATVTENEDAILTKALEILARRLMKVDVLHATSSDATEAYLKLKVAELGHEVFGVLFLDNQHHLIEDVELFRGTIDGASVYPREVLKEALSHNAAAVIFYHNHPSGLAEPSQADQAITARLVAALKLVDIRVLDHIIVGGMDTYCFASHGLI